MSKVRSTAYSLKSGPSMGRKVPGVRKVPSPLVHPGGLPLRDDEAGGSESPRGKNRAPQEAVETFRFPTNVRRPKDERLY